jgi:hypothetical protein
MDLFAIAARLNSQGVAALLQGEDKSAVAALTQSIKIIKQVLSQQEEPTYTAFADDFELSTTALTGFQAGQEAHLFTEAFSFPERPASIRSCAPNKSHVKFYAAAVIFNIALAHHRQGQKGDAARMINAQNLYGMILRLIDGDNCQNRSAVIVKLAVINNLSQIHFDCGDYELAHQGMAHISSLMMCISGTCNHAVFEEPEVQSILLNMLLLKAPRLAPAA